MLLLCIYLRLELSIQWGSITMLVSCFSLRVILECWLNLSYGFVLVSYKVFLEIERLLGSKLIALSPSLEIPFESIES